MIEFFFGYFWCFFAAIMMPTGGKVSETFSSIGLTQELTNHELIMRNNHIAKFLLRTFDTVDFLNVRALWKWLVCVLIFVFISAVIYLLFAPVFSCLFVCFGFVPCRVLHLLAGCGNIYLPRAQVWRERKYSRQTSCRKVGSAVCRSKKQTAREWARVWNRRRTKTKTTRGASAKREKI